jgi:hypothetical protein
MLASIVNVNKPHETGQGLDQKVSSPVRAVLYGPTRGLVLPVYRANLTHPVMTAEHGNAVSPARLAAGQTSPQGGFGGAALGRSKKPMPGCNARDMPTSVWSEMAGTYVEPPIKVRIANDDQRLLVDAS